jgi:hypothetical protein
MESWGYAIIASACLCFGGISFGMIVVLAVQWFSRLQARDQVEQDQQLSKNRLPEEKFGSCWLVITQGPKRGATILVDHAIMRIGRDPVNEIVIDHPQVSRQHSRLTWQSNQVFVEDAGSSNGTFVNGARLTSQQQLNNGDVIGLGGIVLMTFYR